MCSYIVFLFMNDHSLTFQDISLKYHCLTDAPQHGRGHSSMTLTYFAISEVAILYFLFWIITLFDYLNIAKKLSCAVRRY